MLRNATENLFVFFTVARNADMVLHGHGLVVMPSRKLVKVKIVQGVQHHQNLVLQDVVAQTSTAQLLVNASL